MAELNVSRCLSCKQVDDHPKHRMVMGAEQNESAFHMDCHALMGCEICVITTQNQGDKRGAEFREVLETEADDVRAQVDALNPVEG